MGSKNDMTTFTVKPYLVVLFCVTIGTFTIPQSKADDTCIDEIKRLDVTDELKVSKNYLGNNTRRVSEIQVLLSKIGGYTGKIDGLFGKGTQDSLCGSLQMYIAIGGSGPDWGIKKVSDVDRYIDWLYSAVNANETGGEFPD